MQEGYTDYYEANSSGCCLNCPKRYPGCLCPNCNCSKCYWYTPPQDYDGQKGHCDYTDVLIEEQKEKRKEEFKAECEFKEKQESIKSNWLKRKNDILYTQLKINESIAVNIYTCQKCHREFVSKEDKKVIINTEPLCFICNGEYDKESDILQPLK